MANLNISSQSNGPGGFAAWAFRNPRLYHKHDAVKYPQPQFARTAETSSITYSPCAGWEWFV